MRSMIFVAMVVASVVPALSAPAMARQHLQASRSVADRHQHYRHHFVSRRAVPAQAENVAPGLYDYAPAEPMPQRVWGRDNWSQSNRSQSDFNQSAPLDAMAAAQAAANGVPVSLVERVIKRESGGNPSAVSRGNYGLMQIRLGTARAMGYSGSAAGLLDAQTNMTYAVRYLAGAYRAAGGNENRAVALYARGYYYQAKAQGFSPYAAEVGSGFGAYSPGALRTAETFGGGAPVYHLRHRRHHAV